MAEFEDAIDIVLAHEGGFVDHPDDPGGATNLGISLRFIRANYRVAEFDVDGDGDLDADDMRELSRDKAIEIYRVQFWNRYRYGEIGDLSVAIKLFDLCVNMGPRQAHKLIQRACRANGWTLTEDGLIGPNTLRAINSMRPWPLLCSLRSEAAGFYRSLVAKENSFDVFLNGWLNRAYS